MKALLAALALASCGGGEEGGLCDLGKDSYLERCSAKCEASVPGSMIQCQQMCSCCWEPIRDRCSVALDLTPNECDLPVCVSCAAKFGLTSGCR